MKLHRNVSTAHSRANRTPHAVSISPAGTASTRLAFTFAFK